MENSKNNKKKKKGFTLIELVIVLAVMGIIALIAIPSLSGTKQHFKEKADEKSCKTIERAVKVLIADETISESGSLNINFKGGAATAASGTIDAKIIKAINDALKDVGNPQAADHYSITVNNGAVAVTTTSATPAPPSNP